MNKSFDQLLESYIGGLTDSICGFVGRSCTTNSPNLSCDLAIATSLGDSTELYQKTLRGHRFQNLDTLFGQYWLARQAYISNEIPSMTPSVAGCHRAPGPAVVIGLPFCSADWLDESGWPSRRRVVTASGCGASKRPLHWTLGSIGACLRKG